MGFTDYLSLPEKRLISLQNHDFLLLFLLFYERNFGYLVLESVEEGTQIVTEDTCFEDSFVVSEFKKHVTESDSGLNCIVLFPVGS